jgi:acyl carrier protein
MIAETQDKLLSFISQHFRIPRDEIDPQTPLVDKGVIDSFGFVEIAVFLEAEFAITVTDDQINRENFGSVANIANFVASSAAALGAAERPLVG